MNTLCRFFLVAAIFVVSAAFVFAGDASERSEKRVAKAARHSSPIAVGEALTLSLAVEEGETFQVPLVENPTTGFQWQLLSGESADCVKLLHSDYLSPKASAQETASDESPAPTPVVGAPGMRLFTLRGVHFGTTTLRFQYRRAWEKETAPAKELTIVVFVTED